VFTFAAVMDCRSPSSPFARAFSLSYSRYPFLCTHSFSFSDAPALTARLTVSEVSEVTGILADLSRGHSHAREVFEITDFTDLSS
jgi:hypothetical protein